MPSTASVGKGKTDSTYASVTDQAGIFAGTGGFDITVGSNTDLKGAVIASDATPDKNKLSTNTLTYSDIQNNASYSASSSGVNYGSGKGTALKDLGLTPALSTSASGNADTTTKSAVAAGTIEVRSNPTVDLSGLSRDTTNSLNALGKIFDKKTVAEQQELAKVFGEVAFKAIGDLGLPEGSPEKAMLDAAFGGIMAKLGGGSFVSGAAGAGFTQLVMNELKNNIKDTAALQWAAAIVGAVAAKLVGGDAQTGASVAASEAKNNDAAHFWQLLRDNPQLATSLLVLGLSYQIVNGQQQIINKAGEVVATWSPTVQGWVSSAGDFVGKTWTDVTTWFKSKFNPPATDTSSSSGSTVLNNPANNPSSGGTSTTIPAGDPNAGTSTTIPQTQQNTNPVITASTLVPNENGYFGVPGQSSSSSVRNLTGGSAAAQQFFDGLTQGYVNQTVYPTGAIVRTMPDGTKITFRDVSSSDGTPAVDINGSTYKPQKVHFVD